MWSFYLPNILYLADIFYYYFFFKKRENISINNTNTILNKIMWYSVVSEKV